MPNYTWNTLTPDDFRAYRLARYGEAGRCGREGVAKAAKQHGVAIRTWYTYEGGSRSPGEPIKREVARWLNRTVRRDRAKPVAVTVEVSLRPEPEPVPLDTGEANTTRKAAPST